MMGMWAAKLDTKPWGLQTLTRGAIAAVMLGGTVIPATAQQPGLADQVLSQPAQPRPRNCDSSNTIEAKLCAAADFRVADKALNAAYQRVRGRSADDQNRALLLASQRTWMRLRDETCTWEGDSYRGGTLSSLMSLMCLARVTQERVQYLDQAGLP